MQSVADLARPHVLSAHQQGFALCVHGDIVLELPIEEALRACFFPGDLTPESLERIRSIRAPKVAVLYVVNDPSGGAYAHSGAFALEPSIGVS